MSNLMLLSYFAFNSFAGDLPFIFYFIKAFENTLFSAEPYSPSHAHRWPFTLDRLSR